MEPPGSTERESFQDIVEWLSIFVQEETSFEIRIIGLKANKVLVRQFQRSDYGLIEAVAFAIRFGDHSEATYFVLNPLRKESTPPAKDKDVLWRNWLLLDFDPVRQTKVCCTDAEKEMARTHCRKVFRYLRERHWPEPVVADSGNGFHLIYRISLPNQQTERDLIRNVLIQLAEKFDNDQSKLDRSTFNASRLVKVYGTMARKGPSSPTRPHRASKVLYVPSLVRIVPERFLKALVKERGNNGSGALRKSCSGHGIHAEQNEPGRRSRAEAEPAAGCEDAVLHRRCDGSSSWSPEVRAKKYLAIFPPAISGQHGHNTTFRAACCAGPGFGISEDRLFQLMRDIYNPRCEPPWNEKDLQHKVQEAYRREERDRGWMLK
jgi:hypothetical protein